MHDQWGYDNVGSGVPVRRGLSQRKQAARIGYWNLQAFGFSCSKVLPIYAKGLWCWLVLACLGLVFAVLLFSLFKHGLRTSARTFCHFGSKAARPRRAVSQELPEVCAKICLSDEGRGKVEAKRHEPKTLMKPAIAKRNAKTLSCH